MKNQKKLQSLLKKTGLAVMVAGFSFFTSKTFAQDTLNKQNSPMQTQPVKPPTTYPQTLPNQTPPDKTQPAPKVDTSKHMNMNMQNKLPDSELKKIVGSDKQAGKDAMGHILYKEASGRIYYVSDEGKKIYVPPKQ